MRRKLTSINPEPILLVILFLVVAVSNLSWIALDTRPQPALDANKYLEKTIRLSDYLKSSNYPDSIWAAIKDTSVHGRPILYQVLAVPFIFLFGRSADAALLVNLCFTSLLLISTHVIGNSIWDGKTGLFAATIVAAYPPIVLLSKIYRPHFAVPACVAFSIWLLILLLKRPTIKLAWGFGFSLCFGLLVHVFFGYFLSFIQEREKQESPI